MGNPTQLERYKKLILYIEERFKNEISKKDIEDISFYSYRNINRIFLALHHETIGQYVKRIKLEKAAEYLKFSDENISDIAHEIGYSDVAAFSKAFKKQFKSAPSSFRNSSKIKQYITQKAIFPLENTQEQTLEYEIEEIPSFDILYLTYQGSYENIKEIEKTWKQLISYASKHDLLKDETIILGEILDDDAITDTLHCRYNAGIVLEEEIDFSLKGLFKTKHIPQQKYAKFIHKGSHESSTDTYNLIYGYWITEVQLEFEDKPTLEFYLNDESTTPKKELLTEIYIPVK
ncbi:AraC family transcriptional regulator [Aquimarina aquimarini]|uniref:AraC family transcriptional regulator n=1 Tax=Aquimarina aquimarini TaxID=1191734 RepID=UPI000D5586F5|nr:AraC family transcriptional regulator [Aquimarina aquimarini]